MLDSIALTRSTLDQNELISVCVYTVRDVVASRKIITDLEVWSEFFDLALERRDVPDRDRSPDGCRPGRQLDNPVMAANLP